MKTMRKIFTPALFVVMILFVAGCGTTKASQKQKVDSSSLPVAFKDVPKQETDESSSPRAEDKQESPEDMVFVIVEDIPEFPGGNLEMQKWIASSIKYPEIAQKNGITGRVYVSFVINKVGGVEQARVVHGVDPSLDKEAIRVIESMPKLNPGKQRGKPVKVSFTVPVNFQLQ